MINDIAKDEFQGAIALLLKHCPFFAKLSTVELMYMFYDADMSPSIRRCLDLIDEMQEYPVLTPFQEVLEPLAHWNRWV